MTKNLLSPQVYTFETDKSDRLSIASNLPNSSGSGGGTSSSSSGGSSAPNNTNNNNDSYLLIETGFYLLQEDGSKIIL